jgi:aquaporin NIP
MNDYIFMQVPFYAVAQLTGSISASFTLRLLLHPIKDLGTTSPSGSAIQSLIMEIVVTFSMMFIASAVATDTKAVKFHSISKFINLFIMLNVLIS